jgi:hypothetical protein
MLREVGLFILMEGKNMSQAESKYTRLAGHEAQFNANADHAQHNSIAGNLGMTAGRGIVPREKLKSDLTWEGAATEAPDMPLDEVISKAEALLTAIRSVSEALAKADEAYAALFNGAGNASFAYAALLGKGDMDILLGNIKDSSDRFAAA